MKKKIAPSITVFTLAFSAVCLTACETTPSTFSDITGQNRNSDLLQMISAQCWSGAQQAGQQYINNRPGANCVGQNSCAMSGLADGIMASNIRNDSYRNCMMANGWKSQ
jgi:hypothetical protein